MGASVENDPQSLYTSLPGGQQASKYVNDVVLMSTAYHVSTAYRANSRVYI